MSNKSENNPKKVEQEPVLESRKMLYAHCIDMHKVFLTWRERLLAGYATMIAALAFAYSWAYNSENSTYFSRAICVAGILLTVVFLRLDRRTRALYRSCIEVGFNVERHLGIANHEQQRVGFYSIFHISPTELEDMNTDANRSRKPGAGKSLLYRLWNTRNVRRLRWWASSHSGAIDILAFVPVIGMLILLICPPKHSLPPAEQATRSGIEQEVVDAFKRKDLKGAQQAWEKGVKTGKFGHEDTQTMDRLHDGATLTPLQYKVKHEMDLEDALKQFVNPKMSDKDRESIAALILDKDERYEKRVNAGKVPKEKMDRIDALAAQARDMHIWKMAMPKGSRQ
jgi:hypothetical protein